MNLLLFRHNWGLEVSSWEEKLRKIKQAGFAGVETGTVHAADYGHFRDLLAQYKLRFLPQVFTHGVTVAEHVGSFRRQLLALREFRPICINCHSGCDGWAHDMATRFYREVLSIEADAGIPVAHETHRDRCFYNPWSTARLLQTFSRLRICADFSHWVCVCERLLTTEEDILRECARRTIHIHARIGYENGPQVPDPRAPEWQAHVEAHEKWWTWIWEAQRKRGSPETTLTPEFGPPSCLHTLPYTQAPVAELGQICTWQARRQARRFKQWSATSPADPSRSLP
jgi:sugar phosphate isomerase/epimerase